MLALRQKRHAGGFSLIEILITLLIVSVGMLGLVGLQTESLKFNSSSLQRTKATILANDILDRIRANRERAIATNDYNIALDESAGSSNNCQTSLCSPAQIARFDLAQWRDAIDDALPGATGSVTRTNETFTVSIRFEENAKNLSSTDVGTGAEAKNYTQLTIKTTL